MQNTLCFTLFLLLLDPIKSDYCPSVCQQMACKTGILTCPEGGLRNIPELLPPQTTKVLLVSHIFDSPHLSSANFSQYHLYNIAKLTILNCSIVSIEPETFLQLMVLQTLDLSKNKIKQIKPSTFKGLRLSFLRLDENKNIELRKNSFSGLTVTKLSLNDCDLNDLNFDSFSDIAYSLKRLTLTQNNLRIIDSRFSDIFRTLVELELNNNPLDCSCDMKWLSKVLKSRRDRNVVGSLARCASPPKLTNELISILNDSDYVCGIPSLVELDLFILTNDSAKLSCVTAGNQNSQIMWHFFDNEGYRVVPNSMSFVFNSTIQIKRKYPTDKYFCSAQNHNGNSTIEIRIKWPQINRKSVQNPSGGGDMVKKIPHQTFEKDFFFQRQFTLLEMIGGVVGTFTGTLLLFLLIYRCFIQKHRKESRKRKLYETVLYSDSQTYDIPHQPYYPIHAYQTSPAHYLDFKNPQIVNNPQIL